MTIQAQPISPPHTPSDLGGRADRPTTGHHAFGASRVEAYALLDHRTRSRTIAPETAPSGRYLAAEHGDRVRLIPLDRPLIHIGRGLSADVRLEDPLISRRHAIIVAGGDSVGNGARVLDDRSHNGTYVNGRAVSAGQLANGDVLRLGRVVLRFVEIPPAVRQRPVRRIPIGSLGRRHVVAAAAPAR